MTRFRLPIFALMALVTVLGLALAMIRVAPLTWVWPAYSLTVLSLALAALASWIKPAPTSHVWFGYAISGTAYLILIMGPTTPEESIGTLGEDWDDGKLFPFLRVWPPIPFDETWISSFARRAIGPEPMQPSTFNQIPDTEPQQRYASMIEDYYNRYFAAISFTNLALTHLFGLLGGLAALWMTPRTQPTTPGVL